MSLSACPSGRFWNLQQGAKNSPNSLNQTEQCACFGSINCTVWSFHSQSKIRPSFKQCKTVIVAVPWEADLSYLRFLDPAGILYTAQTAANGFQRQTVESQRPRKASSLGFAFDSLLEFNGHPYTATAPPLNQQNALKHLMHNSQMQTHKIQAHNYSTDTFLMRFDI